MKTSKPISIGLLIVFGLLLFLLGVYLGNTLKNKTGGSTGIEVDVIKLPPPDSLRRSGSTHR